MVNQREYDRDAETLYRLYKLGVNWTGISMEPQLGHIQMHTPTDWVITGGESRQAVWERNEQGEVVRKPHEPRPYHVEWVESLIEQCANSNTPLFVKQMGDNAQHQGMPIKYKAGGKNPSEWAPELRVQQMPRVYDNEPARTLL